MPHPIKAILLKINMPMKNKTVVHDIEYINRFWVTPSDWKNPNLKFSIIEVIGFKKIIVLYLFGTDSRGYIIGEAYINNWVPKPNKWFKSLYFVVRDAAIIPKPWPRIAIWMTKKGRVIKKPG